MIGVSSSGSWDKTLRFLKQAPKDAALGDLKKYGEKGVRALANATPKETGETAESWDYRIVHEKGRVRIEWFNTHVEDGAVIAILVQYGHGTGTGGWVEGRDYINPAMAPIFDEIVAGVWKEVTA